MSTPTLTRGSTVAPLASIVGTNQSVSIRFFSNNNNNNNNGDQTVQEAEIVSESKGVGSDSANTSEEEAKMQELEADLQKALDNHRQVLAAHQTKEDKSTVLAVLESLSTLRDLYQELQRLEDAVAVEKAYRDYLSPNVDNHLAEFSHSLHREGYLHMQLRDFARARKIFQQSLKINSEQLFPNVFHNTIGGNFNALGMIAIEEEQDTQLAQRYLLQAEEHTRYHGMTVEEVVAKDDAQAESIVMGHGVVVDDDDEDDDDQVENEHLRNRMRLIAILENRAQVYRFENSQDKALPIYQEIEMLLQKEKRREERIAAKAGTSDDDTKTTTIINKENATAGIAKNPDSTVDERLYGLQLDMADCHSSVKDFSTALSMYKSLLQQEKDIGEPRSFMAGLLHRNIGMVYIKEERIEDALDQFVEARDIMSDHLPATHPEMGTTVNAMGVAYALTPGKHREALTCFREALLIARMNTEYDRDELDPLIQNLLRNINKMQTDIGTGGTDSNF